MRPLLQVVPQGRVPIIKPQFYGFERGIDGRSQTPFLLKQITTLEQIACKRYDYQNAIPLTTIHDRFDIPTAEFGGYSNANMRNTNTNPTKKYPQLKDRVY